ncbi:MAG: hypothetical protein ACKVX7_13830 [Planctomycetota bacterium]
MSLQIVQGGGVQRLLLGGVMLASWLVFAGCIQTASDSVVPETASTPTVTARLGYWRPQKTGDLRIGTRSITGTSTDLERTFDIEDQDGLVYSADLRFGRFGIDASFFELKHDGFQRLDRELSFRGQTFAAGTDVDTNLDLNIATAHLRGDLLGAGPIALGPKVGLNYLNGYADVNTTTVAESKQFDEFFPVVGGFVHCGVDLSESWRAFGDFEATGVGGSVGGVTGHFFDGQVRLGVQAAMVQFGVGYRHVDLAVERSRINFEHDFTLSGPMLFIAIALGAPREPHTSLTQVAE